MSGPVVTALLSPNPASGNYTASGSEDTLASGTSAPGVFQLRINTVNMADGDILELRVYTKANAGDTEGQAYYASMANAQNDVLKISLPVATAEDIRFTVKQIAGTNRTYQWSVLNLAGS